MRPHRVPDITSRHLAHLRDEAGGVATQFLPETVDLPTEFVRQPLPHGLALSGRRGHLAAQAFGERREGHPRLGQSIVTELPQHRVVTLPFRPRSEPVTVQPGQAPGQVTQVTLQRTQAMIGIGQCPDQRRHPHGILRQGLRSHLP